MVALKRAYALIVQTRGDYEGKQQTLNGLQLLARYDDNLIIRAEHGRILVFPSKGEGKRLITRLTEEEVVQMARYCWHISAEWDAWSRFV